MRGLGKESDTQNSTDFGCDRQEGTSCHHQSFCCPVSLTEWVIMPNVMCHFLFNDMMDLHMLSLGTLVPQRSCRVFYAKRLQFTEVYTHKDMQYTQGPID